MTLNYVLNIKMKTERCLSGKINTNIACLKNLNVSF